MSVLDSKGRLVPVVLSTLSREYGTVLRPVAVPCRTVVNLLTAGKVLRTTSTVQEAAVILGKLEDAVTETAFVKKRMQPLGCNAYAYRASNVSRENREVPAGVRGKFAVCVLIR